MFQALHLSTKKTWQNDLLQASQFMVFNFVFLSFHVLLASWIY